LRPDDGICLSSHYAANCLDGVPERGKKIVVPLGTEYAGCFICMIHEGLEVT